MSRERILRRAGFTPRHVRDDRGRELTVWTSPTPLRRRDRRALAEIDMGARIGPSPRRRQIRWLAGDLTFAGVIGALALATAIAQAMGWLEWMK